MAIYPNNQERAKAEIKNGKLPIPMVNAPLLRKKRIAPAKTNCIRNVKKSIGSHLIFKLTFSILVLLNKILWLKDRIKIKAFLFKITKRHIKLNNNNPKYINLLPTTGSLYKSNPLRITSIPISKLRTNSMIKAIVVNDRGIPCFEDK